MGVFCSIHVLTFACILYWVFIIISKSTLLFTRWWVFQPSLSWKENKIFLEWSFVSYNEYLFSAESSNSLLISLCLYCANYGYPWFIHPMVFDILAKNRRPAMLMDSIVYLYMIPWVCHRFVILFLLHVDAYTQMQLKFAFVIYNCTKSCYYLGTVISKALMLCEKLQLWWSCSIFFCNFFQQIKTFLIYELFRNLCTILHLKKLYKF